MREFHQIREVIDPEDGEIFLVVTGCNGVDFQVDKHVWDEFVSTFPYKSVYVANVGPNSNYAIFHHEGLQYFHRWISWMFGPPYSPDKPTVDHIDRNSLNNRCKNLRWASQSEQNFNQNKRIREERDVPCIWEGFTCQDIVCGVYYRPPGEHSTGHFAIDYKGLKRSMCKDKNVPLIQKYAETLEFLIDSGVEDREDRVRELRRQLSTIRNAMSFEIAPKKSRHSARQYADIKDASGKTYTVMQWTLGDDVLNAAIFDPELTERIIAANPDKDHMVRPEHGTHTSLAKYIYHKILGKSHILDDGSTGQVFPKNGIRMDFRKNNLILLPSGSNTRPSQEFVEIFNRFLSGDSTVSLDYVPSAEDFYVERIYTRSGESYTLVCNAEDSSTIKSLIFSPDKRSLKVVIRKKSGEIHHSISRDENFLSVLNELERINGKKVVTITLASFVYYFICKNSLSNYNDMNINTFTNQIGDVRRDNIWAGVVKDFADPFNIANDYKELGFKFLPFRVRAFDSKRQISFQHFALDSSKSLPKPTRETILQYVERGPIRIRELDSTNQYDSLNEKFNKMCATHPDFC